METKIWLYTKSNLKDIFWLSHNELASLTEDSDYDLPEVKKLGRKVFNNDTVNYLLKRWFQIREKELLEENGYYDE